jgi:hypothetical protein
MSNYPNMTKSKYFITFRNENCFNRACDMAWYLLFPDDINKETLEMSWNEEWYRNHAVSELFNKFIGVDAYELE